MIVKFGEGIPPQLRKNYLILWAVGTLIGATQMVDIIFTRAGNLARIKVAVLDPKKIPQTLEVVFGKYLHAIYFIVEEGVDREHILVQTRIKIQWMKMMIF